MNGKITKRRFYTGTMITLSILVLAMIVPMSALAGTNSWTSIGPVGVGIYEVALSPDYAVDKTIFAGSTGNGVYKSTNGGASWIQTNAGLTDPYVPAIAVSPIYRIDSTVFAGTWYGLFKSTNGGATWTKTSLGNSPTVLSIAISPDYASDGTVFAGTAFNGLFRSVDRGATWMQLNPGVWNTNYAVALSSSYTYDGLVYAGTSANPGYSGIYKSNDRGANWSVIGPAKWFYDFGFSPTFSDDGIVFAGSDSIYRSYDRGSTWTQNPETTSGIQSIEVSPNFMVDGTAFSGTRLGGVYKTANRGVNWVQKNSGLGDINVNSVAISPNYMIDSTVFAGTISHGVYVYTDVPSAPSLSNIMPTSGPVGTSVTLNGTNFGATQGTSTVKFNGIPATSIISWTNTQIIAIVPSSATTGDVKVTVNGIVSNGIIFTVTSGCTPIRYEQTDSHVSWAGAWSSIADAGASGGSRKYSNDTNTPATCTFRFTGSCIKWIGTKAANRGKSTVSIDGGAPITVDLYNATTLKQAVVYQNSSLTSGNHTMTIKVTNTKNASSIGYYSDIDAFEAAGVPTGCIMARYEQTDSHVSWAGAWSSIADAGASGGSRKYSNDTVTPATSTFKFTGSCIKWIGTKAANRGKSTVSIDGGAPVTVDLYNATTLKQAVIYQNSSLTSGTHTIVIKATNTKNAASTGYYCDVDAFDAEGVPSGCVLNRYEQTDSHVSWAGAWSSIADAGASGGSRKYSNDTTTPATCTFKFTGSCIKWIGTKAANRGKSTVSIDGGAPVTVDLYNATTLKQAVIYQNSSLSAGAHTVVIKLTKTKNAASTGYYSDVDAFDAEGV